MRRHSPTSSQPSGHPSSYTQSPPTRQLTIRGSPTEMRPLLLFYPPAKAQPRTFCSLPFLGSAEAAAKWSF